MSSMARLISKSVTSDDLWFTESRKLLKQCTPDGHDPFINKEQK